MQPFAPIRELRSFIVRHRTLLFVPVACFWPGVVHSASDNIPVIDVHVQMLNADNSPPGVDSGSSEFAIALLDQAGIEYRYHATTMTRSLQLLQTRENVLVYPISRTTERESKMHWLGMVRPMQLSLIGLNSRRDELPTSLSETSGFSIGVFRGSYIEAFLGANNINDIVYYSDIASTFAMLERRRFDLFPFEADAVGNYAEFAGYSRDFAVALFPLEGTATELFYAMSLPTDEAIISRMRQAFQVLVEDGTYTKLTGRPYSSQFDDW